MKNISNNTLSTSNTSATKTVTELWLRLWFEIVEPDIVIFGLITNAVIFLIMPRSGVSVAPSAKICYVSIAISDFINLINSWVLYTTINDSMYVIFISYAILYAQYCTVHFTKYPNSYCNI